jgi:hypothetical protein
LTPVGDTLRQKGANCFGDCCNGRKARRAVGLAKVKCEPLLYCGLNEALHPDAQPIYPAGNVLSTYQVVHGDLKRAWEEADVSVVTDYEHGFQEHSTMERKPPWVTLMKPAG